MGTYFCGGDHNNFIMPKELKTVTKEYKNSYSLPIQLAENLRNINLGLCHIVYQKNTSSNAEEWLIQIEGFNNTEEVVLFDKILNISKICMTPNFIIGLNETQNSLYYAELKLNNNENNSESSKSIYSVVKVENIDPLVQIIDIITNDQVVYGLDSTTSKIYEIHKNLVLKWNFHDIVEIRKIVCGFGHYVLLTDAGALYSWGFGGRGELGHAEHDHAMVQCEIPKRIEFFDDLVCTVKDIVCGGWHTLALTSDGDVYSWGWGESGQLGHPKSKLPSAVVGGVPYPIDLGSADDPIEQIACGARHSVAVLKSGSVFSWGFNKYGNLGVGDHENRQEPTAIIKCNIQGTVKKVTCGRWSLFIYTL